MPPLSFDIPETGEPPRHPAFASGRRRTGALLPTIVILLVLAFGFSLFADFWTDLLWFRSVGYASVFTAQLGTKIGLFLAFGLLMALIVGANMLIAYRLRPGFRGMTLEQQSLDRYRMALEPYRRLVLLLIAGGIGVLAGISAAGQWRTWLAWRNGARFDTRDPQFQLDVSFYTFGYPWWRFLLSFAFAAVILSLILTIATHYLYGGLRLQSPGEKATPAAQAHLSVLLGVFVLLKAGSYWLDRYGLAVQSDNFIQGWAGLKYKDVHAVLPAKTILAAIAVICALLFFLNVVRRTWLLPGLGFGLLVLSAVLIGGVYPAIVQQFQVRPSEADKEAPYIKRNIEATRKAYGLDNVETKPYDAKTEVTAGQLRDDAETTNSIRLLDPSVVPPTFQQLQQIRSFYSFPSEALDVDRYMIDGKLQDTVVAVRELDLGGIPDAQRSWVNDHLKYTHGYGFVAALGTTRDAKGQPVFVESNVPPSGKMGQYEPRIYFGEKSPEYSIVGAPPGAEPRELDYPDDSSPSGEKRYTYQGKGGVPIGSLFNKLLYTIKFREEKILLSSAVNSRSKILYIRDPRQRVQKVAPWLTLDGDPYPAVVKGRIMWIVDGYTTANGYPYSTRTTLGAATSDSLTTSQRTVLALRDQINYIRNSVKATVDAYDGTVTLYAWDENDPVLKTWMSAFPGTVKPRKDISPELMSHLRYPQDLFKVQRDIFTRYHVTDPQSFYGGQDFWKVPADPTQDESGDRSADQPPYYLTMQMPGQDRPTFSLSTSFVPNKRTNLAAFMAVNAQPGPDYGKIRVLELSRNTTIPGPGQVQNNFESNPEVSRELSLLRGRGSEVKRGNLLTLPVGGGLLYVEPIYIQAATGTSYPLLHKVVVGFGDQIQMRETLQQALDAVFQGDAGSQTGEGQQPAKPGKPSQPAPPGGDLQQALRDAQQAYQDGQEALKNGDFAKYGEAQRRLKEALDRAARASQGGGSTPPPSPTPSPAPAG
ncbi:UPF0182 family membrane protein [Carbonactinospora thermoautotrophica]|uniref:UPF0182 family membrane protein n=1 Tax=Carbonactinospora thermoautotrophica TaxID=1469144 RepID=UPI000B2920FE